MYKLLIVDDEEMIRLGIKNGINWTKIGIEQVFTAASAKEALEIIGKEQPQIILTDISMTEMSGLDLIDKIRSRYREEDMRIIVLTGYDRFDYARKCLQMRVQNFLLKPIDEEELKENVKEQIVILDKLQTQREQKNQMIRTEGSKRQFVLENFLRNLVHRTTVYEEGKEYSEELKNERHRKMQLAMLIPDVYMDKTEEDEKKFLQILIKNICMDLIDARGNGITFVDDGKIMMVLYLMEQGSTGTTEQIQSLSEILEDECNIRPRIILGSEVDGFDSLYVSYNDVLFLLEQERKGFREIVRTSHEQKKEQILQDVYVEFKRTMLANIADGEQVLHVFHSFCQAMESYNVSKKQVQRWCFEISSGICYSYISDTGDAVDGKLEALMKTLAGAGREEAMEVTAMFISALVFKEEGEQDDIIRGTRRYIDEHLDSELSVANLADMFYVSPNYFSRLFKKVMKEGCNEYIVRKRIEKSKFLLETTTIKAGKIATLVGYNDTNYFSLAFKKHAGVSPTKYREMSQKKDSKL